ncbi:MAG TPA: thioredoxin [Oligoflexia bacterium]|nr:thioredoxin [Oligoflexia bacterium]HMP47389.1 thioredoxin [Oligoflexia bacterium]
MSKPADVSDSNFDSEVLKSAEPVLVDFWAPWCGPCKAIAPIIEELAGQFAGKLKVVKVNVDDNKDAAHRYNVRGIPNLILFKDGQMVDQMIGARTKQELVDLVNKAVS